MQKYSTVSLVQLAMMHATINKWSYKLGGPHQLFWNATLHFILHCIPGWCQSDAVKRQLTPECGAIWREVGQCHTRINWEAVFGCGERASCCVCSPLVPQAPAGPALPWSPARSTPSLPQHGLQPDQTREREGPVAASWLTGETPVVLLWESIRHSIGLSLPHKQALGGPSKAPVFCCS